MFFRLPGKALFARQRPRSALSWDTSREVSGSVQEPFPDGGDSALCRTPGFSDVHFSSFTELIQRFFNGTTLPPEDT